MLQHLSIKNIVLIEQATLDFESGFCVLSGETGAGKSILLDALGLVLGNRSEARLVRKGEEKASVTAEFSLLENTKFQEQLQALDIESEEDILILRRQLSADGKSRAYVNDQPVSIGTLKTLGEMLVEIHGQHQQRGLQDPANHLTLLDRYGGHETDLKKVKTHYLEWKNAKTALKTLEEEIEQTSREKDYLEHMHKELKALNPEPGEEEELTDKRLRMMQSEKMASTLDEVMQELTQPKDIYDGLRSAQSTLSRSTLKEAEQFSPAIEALERAMIELQEAQAIIQEIGHRCDYDEHELEQVEERLFALKAASRKYNLPPEELPTLYAQVEEKLETLAEQSKQLTSLKENVTRTQQIFVETATKLTETRKKTASKLEKALHKELEPLKMGATRFQVTITEKPESSWSESGIDSVQFEAATNKGSDIGPIANIASGGELSRFMLALAVILGGSKTTPCMIFDEIDTGTGGAVADAIGQRLAKLGQQTQVIVVTHLPQVAARAAQHHFIEKEEKSGKTLTKVSTLDDTSRREELARMLSGANITEQAREAARKLMEESKAA